MTIDKNSIKYLCAADLCFGDPFMPSVPSPYSKELDPGAHGRGSDSAVK